MAITFENEKILFDDKYRTAKEIDCFLPVHLTIGGKENDLYKKDGSHNEQYYKWQFLYCFVSAGLCSKDFIGVEVSFRFLYKGIIIKHNKTEPTYTKTSLFLCEKRRFFMGRTEKGGKVF